MEDYPESKPLSLGRLKNDLALAIGFALSFGLCYNVWANDLCNISELKNERNTSLDHYGVYDIDYYKNVIGALI